MSTVLVAAYRQDIREHLRLANTYGCGIEIQAFSCPQVLDGEWRVLLDEYQHLLRDFDGPLSFHGAFFDMSGASEDARVVALTKERYRLSLDIAAELGARKVIFHTSFLPMIRNERYRRQYIERDQAFWAALAEEATERDLWVVVENMWDPTPAILAEIMQGIPTTVSNVGICLDISHVCLYNNAHPFAEWIEVLEPYIVHIHMNNTLGVIDEHLALNISGGAIDYARILPLLANLARKPWLVLEIDDPVALERSLRFAKRVLGASFGTREPTEPIKTPPPA
ncbi:MAG: sugar phosphate isomerase/epimerase family protein [Anaerolineales bacterium]